MIQASSQLARLFAAAAAVVATLVAPSSFASGTWSARNAMPAPISGAPAAVVDGIVYLAGGFFTNSSCNAVASLSAYDPSSDTWSARQALPSARSQVGLASFGGKLYAFGGSLPCGETEIADALSYDPATNAWTGLGPVPGTPTGLNATSAVTAGDRIYLLGGLRGNPNQWVADVFAYDPATDTYTPRAPMPFARYTGAAAFKDGRIYVMGGQPGLNVETQIYDVATDTWSLGAPMPQGNCCAQGAIAGDRIFVLGGASPAGDSFSYDPSTDTWRPEPAMPTPRANHASAAVGGVVYTMGGQLLTTLQATRVVEAFTPLPDNHRPSADAGPDQVVEAGPNCTADAALDGTGSSDPDGDALAFAWTGAFGTASGPTPTVRLGLGTHAISLQVDDGRGGTASDATQVTVVDASAPQIIAAGASPPVLWPPNHRMVDVQVFASATDNCGAAACRIAGIASSEPEDSAGDGATARDWIITGNLTVQLRAERAGGGTDRVYTIRLLCTDAAGLATSREVQVTVPHGE